jgi:hypothetical protein
MGAMMGVVQMLVIGLAVTVLVMVGGFVVFAVMKSKGAKRGV